MMDASRHLTIGRAQSVPSPIFYFESVASHFELGLPRLVQFGELQRQ